VYDAGPAVAPGGRRADAEQRADRRGVDDGAQRRLKPVGDRRRRSVAPAPDAEADVPDRPPIERVESAVDRQDAREHEAAHMAHLEEPRVRGLLRPLAGVTERGALPGRHEPAGGATASK
jgi:hypothetical protein